MLQLDYSKIWIWMTFFWPIGPTLAVCGRCAIFSKCAAAALLELKNRQFYNERFEIIFNQDIAFGQELVAVVEVAQSYFGGRLRVGTAVHGVADDDIVGGYGDIDG